MLCLVYDIFCIISPALSVNYVHEFHSGFKRTFPAEKNCNFLFSTKLRKFTGKFFFFSGKVVLFFFFFFPHHRMKLCRMTFLKNISRQGWF